MKVNIVKGPRTDENIQKCYDVIVEVIRKEQLRDSDICKGIDRRTSDKRI